MARFILMYAYGPDSPPRPTDEDEMRSLVSDYAAWTQKARADGRYVGGARLTDVYTDPGRICTENGDDFLVTDGPMAETKEVIGGYAVIEAANYAEAASLCRNHPAARDGRIWIRQLA
ncbi:MAG: YciI family protein [Myxococcota bacterium]|nr:YciI family protein [Myxococcota bacterium]